MEPTADNKNHMPLPQVPARPNESGKISVEDFVKIFDPNTQEILLEKRN